MNDFYSEMMAALMPTILAILGIIGSIVTLKLNGYLDAIQVKTGVEIEAKRRDALMEGLRNALFKIMSTAAHGGGVLTVKGVIVDAASMSNAMKVTYMTERVKERYPDAVNAFKLHDRDIADMAEIVLEQINVDL